MIVKSLAHCVFICQDCGHIMVGLPASQGVPGSCPACGVSRDVSLTPDQRAAIENERRRQGVRGGRVHPGMGAQTFTVRF